MNGLRITVNLLFDAEPAKKAAARNAELRAPWSWVLYKVEAAAEQA